MLLVALGCTQLFCAVAAQDTVRDINDLIKWTKAGEEEKSLIAANKVLTSYPNNVFALQQRARLLAGIGRTDQALADINKAISLYPKLAESYTYRAQIERSVHKIPEAVKDYSKAVELNPKEKNMYRNRGQFFFGQKQFDKAAADYTEALRLSAIDHANNKHLPADFASWSDYNLRGQCYLEMKRFQDAVSDFTNVLKIRTGYPEAYRHRAQAYKALGKLDAAQKDSRAADAMVKDFEPPSSLGD